MDIALCQSEFCQIPSPQDPEKQGMHLLAYHPLILYHNVLHGVVFQLVEWNYHELLQLHPLPDEHHNAPQDPKLRKAACQMDRYKTTT